MTSVFIKRGIRTQGGQDVKKEAEVYKPRDARVAI